MIEKISIESSTRNQMIDITEHIMRMVSKNGIIDGICTVFVPHTTAAVTINENADPDVKTDLISKLGRLIPENDGYRHTEGNSDAHLKSSLFGPSLQVIVSGGKPVLGTWQGIYFCEFDGPRTRSCIIHVK